MTKASQIIEILEYLAPLDIQEEWDNSGLCIGNAEREVTSLLLALDCTEEVLDEAVKLGAEMIVTHHPLIFRGIKQITQATFTERIIGRAIKNDIVIYSLHTNLDKVIAGVSGEMASKLGLSNLSFLDPDPGGDTGLGVVGNFIEPLSFNETILRVKRVFGTECVKSSRPLDKLVSRVALCGGSGASLIEAAKKSNADVFITADLSYHLFFTEPGFALMDIGHFESESCILEVIKNELSKKMATFAIHIASSNINPIYYY